MAGMTSPKPVPEAFRGRHFQAVIFDVDQTLVDSTRALGVAWTTWMREYDITPEPGRSFHGWTTEDIVRLCLPDAQVPGGLARIDELERVTTEQVTATPGAARALDELPADRVAVGTSGTREVASARLAAAGLPVPRVLSSATDVAQGKPAPDIFLRAAELLGVEPARCLVVEDAASGVAAARAAGMAVLAVLTSTPAGELDADAHVGTLDEVTWTVDERGISLA